MADSLKESTVSCRPWDVSQIELLCSLSPILFCLIEILIQTCSDVFLFWTLLQDVSAKTSMKCPELYRAGIQNLFFKWRVIAAWLVAATFQSLIFFYFPVVAAQKAQNSPGRMFGVWDVSTMAYTCILITVNLRLMMASSSLTSWHLISVGGSIGAWFVFVFIYSGIQVTFIQVLWPFILIPGLAVLLISSFHISDFERSIYTNGCLILAVWNCRRIYTGWCLL